MQKVSQDIVFCWDRRLCSWAHRRPLFTKRNAMINSLVVSTIYRYGLLGALDWFFNEEIWPLNLPTYLRTVLRVVLNSRATLVIELSSWYRRTIAFLISKGSDASLRKSLYVKILLANMVFILYSFCWKKSWINYTHLL